MTGKTLLFLFVLSAVGLAARTSEATQGNLTIYQNTVLQEDHYGTITFGGDNIFLDCNDKKIIFDATVPTSYNCTTVFPMTCGRGTASFRRSSTTGIACWCRTSAAAAQHASGIPRVLAWRSRRQSGRTSSTLPMRSRFRASPWPATTGAIARRALPRRCTPIGYEPRY